MHNVLHKWSHGLNNLLEDKENIVSMAIHFDRLIDWAEGRLAEHETNQISQQIAMSDASEQSLARWLKALVAAGRELRFVSPPEQLHRMLISTFEQHLHEQVNPNPWRRLVASLSFDSALQNGLVGVRSTSTIMPRRQLVYSTDAVELILNIHRHATQTQVGIEGQVLNRQADMVPDYVVQVLQGEREVGITVTDELGEFAFEGIDTGECQIVVCNDRLEIYAGPFNLSI